MFVVDRNLFNLKLVDDNLKKIGVRQIDGDKPSTLLGVSLTAIDCNLHQHGMAQVLSNATKLHKFSFTIHLSTCIYT